MSTADKAVKVATTETQPAPSLEWVVVPQKDILDCIHPGVRINRDTFGPGKHLVKPEIAAEIRERLAIYDAQTIRILQPKKDLKALQDLYKVRGAEAVDLTPNNTKNDNL